MMKDSDDYDLREEYDLSQLPIRPKGRYDPARRQGRNIVVLEPELAAAFPNDEAVNEALRLVIQLARVPRREASASGAA